MSAARPGRIIGVELEADGKADVAEIVEDGRIVRHRLKVSVKPVHDFFVRRPRSAVVVTDGKGAWWLAGALASFGHEVVVVAREQPAIAGAAAERPGSRLSEVIACMLRDRPGDLEAVEPVSPVAQLQGTVTALCEDLAGTLRQRLRADGVEVADGSAADLVAAWPGLAVPDALRAELQGTVDTMAELTRSADVVSQRVRLVRDG